MKRNDTDHPPFIKVCGQTHPASVDCAVAYGARYVGFVFHAGSPRSVSPETVAAINTAHVGRVGVFVRQGADEILPIMQQARLDYAQLHGAQSTTDAKLIDPMRVIRVLWPEQAGSLQALQEQIDAWEPYCAAYLLDAGSMGQGGSGRRLALEELGGLRFPHPWILAGGLSAENLSDTLAQCRPDGIDLNSGIEIAPGIKSADKMLAAFTAVSRVSSSAR